jgi:hypothetical protein
MKALAVLLVVGMALTYPRAKIVIDRKVYFRWRWEPAE